MKKYTFLFFLIFAAAKVNSQTPGIKWQRPIGGTSSEDLQRTVYTNDGNLLYAMQTRSFSGDVSGAHGLSDILVTKATKEGIVLWSRTYGSSGSDNLLDLQNMPDGGYLLVIAPGANNGDISGYQGNSDIWVAKLSSSGVIQWSHCFGGSSSDYYNNAVINNDGSVLVYGNEFSTNGTFTSNHGSSDIFLCKINSNGIIAWLKCFGGTGSDVAETIYQKPNGSVIITSTSFSSNFDVPNNHGSIDMWVFEVNAAGNIVWNKAFGGTNGERASVFRKTGAAQYTILAQTSSSDGDVTGFHGGNDLWVVTIDTLGNLLWQKALGGTITEIPQSIHFIPGDSTLLISAITNSSNGDISGYQGGQDVWLVKLSNSGTVQWKKNMGGSGNETQQAVIIDSNGHSIHLNSTNSNNGNVSGSHGRSDLWVYKLNGTGNLVWQRALGGSLDDAGKSLVEVSGGYTVMGDIQSRDGDITGMHYRSDTLVGDTSTRYVFYTDVWVANLSAAGDLKWQKSLGGFNNEISNTILYNEEDYFVSATSYSNDGDVVGSHGSIDGWAVRLGATNGITGKILVDRNSNGIQDGGEPLYSNIVIKSEKPGYSRSSVAHNGWYRNDVDTGNYSTSSQINLVHYTLSPPSALSSFNSYFNNDTIDFAIQPIRGRRDLSVNIFPTSAARPGFDCHYKIRYQNIGTDTVTAGSIRLIKDDRTGFVNAVPAPVSVVNDTITWNYSSLKPLDSASINIVLRASVPPTVNLNDTLMHYAEIVPVPLDLAPANNQDTLKQIVIGSFDPNSKSENHAGRIFSAHVNAGVDLDYVINFQNLGTDTAFTVILKDTLSDKLLWESFEMIAASHPFTLFIAQKKLITWKFSNIGLPHSAANDSASKGFVVYRIKPANTLVPGDIIENTASIYFDYNLPVRTNRHETIVQLSPPAISSFDPATANSGATVTIIGENFTGATALSFGGVAANSFTVNSSTSITAVVGMGASGNVSITTPGGTATLAGFTFIPAPTITSFTPAKGAAGASITITGTNLTGATAVSFGGTPATSFTVNSATNITAVVGTGASGSVSVTTPGGTIALDGFTFIPTPTITSFTPASGGTGASVTITGTNLTGATAVSFGGTAATSFTVNSATSISAVVGAGASGNVSVTTPGGTTTLAGFTFTVVTAIDPVSARNMGIRLYPNPTNGTFVIDTLKLGDKWETLEIFDTDGKRKLASFTINNKTTITVNIENLSNGFYTAILRRKKGQAAVIKFLKL